MKDAFDLIEINQEKVIIKIISVSKSSDDAVRNMEKQLDGVDCIYFDVIENAANIREILNDTDMMFLIGATNDSQISEIVNCASELNILTIAVVTEFMPFDANKNITQLLCYVDEGKTLSDVLRESVQGITDCVIRPGFINVDFSDVEQVLSGKSRAIISISAATGENRARDATKQALASPLFRDVDLKKVDSILVNIFCSSIGLAEFNDVGDVVLEQVSESASVKIGMSDNPDLEEVIDVAIVVGF
jgi:cell division protein FtsZ